MSKPMTHEQLRDARETMNWFRTPSYRLGRSLGLGVPVKGECPVCHRPVMVRPPSRNPHIVMYQAPCPTCLEDIGLRMRL